MHLDSEGQPLRWLPTNTAINILRKLESEQVCHPPALLTMPITLELLHKATRLCMVRRSFAMHVYLLL